LDFEPLLFGIRFVGNLKFGQRKKLLRALATRSAGSVIIPIDSLHAYLSFFHC
jgi:hypothetical protein